MIENVVNTILCTQCGGEIHPDEGQIFITCSFCDSTIYVDKGKVVFHWYIDPTINPDQVNSILFRWMSGNQTVKDLDKKCRLISREFLFFPLWYFKVRLKGNGESILLQPAAATSISELKNLKIPAGDLKKYAFEIDIDAQTPTVPLEAARAWLDENIIQGEPLEIFMVHIPIFIIKYMYQNRIYTAVVEAGTGKVFANVYPSKSEAPYILAAGLTALVYLGLASVPVFALFFGNQATGVAITIALVLGLIAAPILFLLAIWVASRI
ncbi:MAG: hypothetical protein CVU46_07455 [Chloroflexi bacterium HGW-Chloroflexi-8]|nr:MAG: hypothetical protein CVU46_07455 [Chloroflexi bacterium HGW-Chloroflexi-8]